MGIENLTKLEANEDGTFIATCSNKCETEQVTANDVILGDMCKQKYPDIDNSFIPVGSAFEFTSYRDIKNHGLYNEEKLHIKDMILKERFILERYNKFHHTLKVDGNDEYELGCTRNFKNRSYKFITSNPKYVLSVDIDEKCNVCSINIRSEDDYVLPCLEGHYSSNELLRLELQKRELRKKMEYQERRNSRFS